mgnify:FL=1
MDLDKTADGIYTGEFASEIKKRTSSVLMGIAIGGFAGFIISSFTGGSKLLWVFGGAALGAGIGKYYTPKESNTTS